MTYIWDTNILLHALRKPDFLRQLNQKYNFDDNTNEVYISAVSVGEIHSIALRNRWGDARMKALNELLQTLEALPITDHPFLIGLYAEIDVFSQSHHPTLPLMTTARKMGKNDLWIAATTAFAQGTLISTDNDFEHLKDSFILFEKIVVT
jgi:predicted nucleic acid-binding protein